MSINFLTIPQKSLTQSISSSATSFKLNNIKSWAKNSLGVNINLTSSDFGTQAFGCFRNSTGTIIEIFELDPATIASSSITILKRGLDFNGDLTTETTNYKLDWPAGTIVMLGTDTPQLFQYLKEYIDGIAIAGAPDASTTVKGIVEEATDAEVTAGTDTGGTGARLFVPPSKLNTQIDAKIAAAVIERVATISMTAADIIAMYVTPKELVAAPGSGLMLLLDEVAFAFTYNSVQFTGGGSVRIQYGGDTTNIMPSMNLDSPINAAATFYRQFNTKASGTSGAIPIPNASLQLTNASAAFATGNSTMKVFIKYRIITL